MYEEISRTDSPKQRLLATFGRLTLGIEIVDSVQFDTIAVAAGGSARNGHRRRGAVVAGSAICVALQHLCCYWCRGRPRRTGAGSNGPGEGGIPRGSQLGIRVNAERASFFVQTAR